MFITNGTYAAGTPQERIMKSTTFRQINDEIYSSLKAAEATMTAQELKTYKLYAKKYFEAAGRLASACPSLKVDIA